MSLASCFGHLEFYLWLLQLFDHSLITSQPQFPHLLKRESRVGHADAYLRPPLACGSLPEGGDSGLFVCCSEAEDEHNLEEAGWAGACTGKRGDEGGR